MEVFVDAPHDQRVKANSRFWNASGLDLTMDATGIQLDTQSIVTVLVGGIAFDVPAGELVTESAAEDQVFVAIDDPRSLL